MTPAITPDVTSSINVTPSRTPTSSNTAQEDTDLETESSFSLPSFFSTSTSSFPFSSFFDSTSETTSGSSRLELPWFSPAGIVKKVMSFWKNEKAAEMPGFSNPYAQDLFALKEKATYLKDNSNHASDNWYNFFLEDLIGDISDDLKKPELITKEMLKEHKLSLSCMRKDFSNQYSTETPQPYEFLPEFSQGLGSETLNRLGGINHVLELGSGSCHLPIGSADAFALDQ